MITELRGQEVNMISKENCLFPPRMSVWGIHPRIEFVPENCDTPFKAHLHYIRDLGPSSDAMKTSELIFRFYTDPSPFLRFLSRTSVSELVDTCSDFLRHRRPRLCNSIRCAWHAFTKSLLQASKMTGASDDLGCSVNKTVTASGTRTRMLGQCICASKFVAGITWRSTIVSLSDIAPVSEITPVLPKWSRMTLIE